MREGSIPKRRDVRKRVELRIDPDTQRKVKVTADKFDVSINHMVYSMMLYCLDSQNFNAYLEERFPRDLTQGFYTYHPAKDDVIFEHIYRR